MTYKFFNKILSFEKKLQQNYYVYKKNLIIDNSGAKQRGAQIYLFIPSD